MLSVVNVSVQPMVQDMPNGNHGPSAAAEPIGSVPWIDRVLGVQHVRKHKSASAGGRKQSLCGICNICGTL